MHMYCTKISAHNIRRINGEEEEDMTIEDGENGNVKYVIFALSTCQLLIHIAKH